MNLSVLFDHLQNRPQVLAGELSFSAIKGYVRGLSMGLRFTGIFYTADEYCAAAEARGWDVRGNIGIERDFRQKSLSDEQMATELIAVEVCAYELALRRLETDATRVQCD